MTTIKKLLDVKPSHILKAEQMADNIYAESNEHHIEMVEVIQKRLIKRNQAMLENLREFGR